MRQESSGSKVKHVSKARVSCGVRTSTNAGIGGNLVGQETVNLTGRHLIGGEWVSSGGAGVRAIDPTSGVALEPPFFQAGEQEVEAAFRAAVAAFAQSRDLPSFRRAELLEAIADQIMALGEALLTTAQQETALPLARLTGERGRTTGQ